MPAEILLVTPPFTQLNTPYPATAYLKGFLNKEEIGAMQLDLSIKTLVALFSRESLSKIFKIVSEDDREMTDNDVFIFSHRHTYEKTIEPVIDFLQNKNESLAPLIATRNYLPEASRYKHIEALDWAFGNMGTRDKAKYLATLYLEDLGDFIRSQIDPYFSFTRYAERLSGCLPSFDPMHAALKGDPSFVSRIYLDLLEQEVSRFLPVLVCLTIPFPGNLFAALKCGQLVKAKFPSIKIAIGGGYCNTELRSLSDARIFEYVDYICLDDGEAPLKALYDHLTGKRAVGELKRVFMLDDGMVQYVDGALEEDIPQGDVGTPDYSGLPIDQYLSLIEVLNPMHRLWNDGYWNKLTLAHGCYWGKCTFCDVSLDYIARYQPVSAGLICDRIEEIIEQTGMRGFHFVDEAAPPALMRDLALEILARGLTISWWTNIRFEKSFTFDLCQLLHASGCIAVSGGLEVASDRLLSLIKKGVTVAQVASVTSAFSEAGIMVHAYLMYGFPTQTAQETVDALEVVRQMFDHDIIQSGYWHLFTMTAHSPVGLAPTSFGVSTTGPLFAGFAHNDLQHEDLQGADHGRFGEGLRRSLYNFMQGIGLDLPVETWFDFEVPGTTVASDLITEVINRPTPADIERLHRRLIWLGGEPVSVPGGRMQGNTFAMEVAMKHSSLLVHLEGTIGEWIYETLLRVGDQGWEKVSLAQLKDEFESTGHTDFSDMLRSEPWQLLRQHGLILI